MNPVPHRQQCMIRAQPNLKVVASAQGHSSQSNPPVNQEVVEQQVDVNQDEGLVSVLILTFKVDPNAGGEVDPQIAQFVENCLNLHSALEWEDMKIIREVHKCLGNCPSI